MRKKERERDRAWRDREICTQERNKVDNIIGRNNNINRAILWNLIIALLWWENGIQLYFCDSQLKKHLNVEYFIVLYNPQKDVFFNTGLLDNFTYEYLMLSYSIMITAITITMIIIIMIIYYDNDNLWLLIVHERFLL